MQKTVVFAVIGLSLAGCADATRTILVPTLEERTISGERAPLVVPPNHQTAALPQPKNDPVISEYNKNNFLTPADRSATLVKPKELRAPLPPRRPCSMGNTPGCDRAK